MAVLCRTGGGEGQGPVLKQGLGSSSNPGESDSGRAQGTSRRRSLGVHQLCLLVFVGLSLGFLMPPICFSFQSLLPEATGLKTDTLQRA